MSKVQIYLLGEDDKAKSQLQQFLAGESISELDTEFPTAVIPEQHTFLSKIGEVLSTTVHYTPGDKRFIPLLKHYINKADIICYVYDFEDKSALGLLTHLLEAQQLHLSYAPLAKNTTPVIIGISGQPTHTNLTVDLGEDLSIPVFHIDLQTGLHQNPGYQALFNYIVEIKTPKGISLPAKQPPDDERFKRYILGALNQLVKQHKQLSTVIKSNLFFSDKKRKNRLAILIDLQARIEYSHGPLARYQGIRDLLCETNPRIQNILTPLIKTLESEHLVTTAASTTSENNELESTDDNTRKLNQ